MYKITKKENKVKGYFTLIGLTNDYVGDRKYHLISL